MPNKQTPPAATEKKTEQEIFDQLTNSTLGYTLGPAICAQVAKEMAAPTAKIHTTAHPEGVDMTEEEFLAELAKHCKCCAGCTALPCAGCTAGGLCDESCHCGDGEDELGGFRCDDCGCFGAECACVEVSR